MSENKATSFWSSLPGTITAIAGMITAIAVLWTTLVNLPSSGSNASPSPSPTTTSSAGSSPSSGTSEETSAEPTDAPSPAPTATAAAALEILFYAVRRDPTTGNDNADLFEIHPVTTRERRVTNDSQPDSDPAWSPDRSRIAFDSKRETGDRNIWVLEADGSYKPLTNDKRSNAYPTWSPDGKQIAWTVGASGGREIWVMDVDDPGGARRLTSGHDDLLPNWRSSGLIAFERKVGGSSEVWVVNPDGGAASARITVSEGGGGDPAWSPDGKRLAFTRRSGDVVRIYVAASNGNSGLKAVSPSSTCPCSSPTWSPDGKQIAYVGGGSGVVRPIYVVSAAGGSARRLTTNGLTPDWGG